MLEKILEETLIEIALSQGWSHCFVAEDDRLWGTKDADSHFDVPFTESESQSIWSHPNITILLKYLKQRHKGMSQFNQLSLYEQLINKVTKYTHNLKSKSCYEIGGIKINNPKRGVAFIGDFYGEQIHLDLAYQIDSSESVNQYYYHHAHKPEDNWFVPLLKPENKARVFLSDLRMFSDLSPVLDLIQVSESTNVFPLICVNEYELSQGRTNIINEILSCCQTYIISNSSDCISSLSSIQQLGNNLYKSRKLIELYKYHCWFIEGSTSILNTFYKQW